MSETSTRSIMLNSVSWLTVSVSFALYWLLYVAALVVYRLYFSPIAKFPGPLLPRITFWYEFYHNWFKTGEYYLRIREMHAKYGPIVRVSPEELHVLEPSFYHKLFVTSAVRKSDGYMRFSQGTGYEDLASISLSHDDHRLSRVPLDPFFSRTGIVKVEPRVVERVRRLKSRLNTLLDTNSPVNLTHAFSSLTTDIISSVIFEEPSDYLGDATFNHEWFQTLKYGNMTVPLLASLPWLARIFTSPVVRSMTEKVTHWRLWDDKIRRQVLETKLRPADEAKTRTNATVLDHLVHNEFYESRLGSQSYSRLAQLIQQAGSHNVTATLTTIITYLCLDETKANKLQEALRPVFDAAGDGFPTWQELEKVPYLTACIQEGLRMAIGSMLRAPRISPDVDLEFEGWVIPKGTPVSMSSFWMHNDPIVFVDPGKFEPERWFCEGEKLKKQQSYYVPFSKGSRTCMGQNLVYMQIYHTLAQLYRPGSAKIRLFETDATDVIPRHGLLFPFPKFDSVGVRATISSE